MEKATAGEIFEALIEKNLTEVDLKGHEPCPFCGAPAVMTKEVGGPMVGAARLRSFTFRPQCKDLRCRGWTLSATKTCREDEDIKATIATALAAWDKRV